MAALIVVASATAIQAGASATAVRRTIPPQGYTTLDRHGCPIFHESSGAVVAAFGTGGRTTTFVRGKEHCVPMAVSVFTLTNTTHQRCVSLTLVQVAYPKGIGPIAAVVYSKIGDGTRWWEQPVNPITGTGSGSGPGHTTGFGGVTYRVPKDEYVWQLGGGSSPAPCDSKPDWIGEAAWAITGGKPVISGKVTDADGKPIEGSVVDISGPTSAQTETGTDGFFGSIPVDPGRYTVTASLPVDGHFLHEKVLACKVGAVSDWDCTGRVRLGKNLVADFRLGRPDLTVTFDPDLVPGNGRGSTNVTIRLTIYGKPIVGHILAGVATVAGRHTEAPTPPTFTSREQLLDWANPSALRPSVVGCAGTRGLGEGKLPLDPAFDDLDLLTTDAQGEIHARLFVGTHTTTMSDAASIGSQLRLTVTDIDDPTPLPGLMQRSATLRLQTITFADSQPAKGISVPTPAALRALSQVVGRPILTSDEHTNQVTLLNWLTEAFAAAGGRHPPFGPIDGHIPNVAPDAFAIYFGLPDNSDNGTDDYTEGLPALDTATAEQIFGSGPLPPFLPTVADSAVHSGLDVPVYPANLFLFYGDGIYPDPHTGSGKQLNSCASDWLDTTDIQDEG